MTSWLELAVTTVNVHAGICGFEAKVQVTRIDRDHVQVRVMSACEQITAMNPDLAELAWRRRVLRMDDSAVHRSAARHIRHAGCPIPSAILKAIEVELGIALPRDVHFNFKAEE